MINISNQDLKIDPRKIVGHVYPPEEEISKLDSTIWLTEQGTKTANPFLTVKPTEVTACLSQVELAELQGLINEYGDIFCR